MSTGYISDIRDALKQVLKPNVKVTYVGRKEHPSSFVEYYAYVTHKNGKKEKLTDKGAFKDHISADNFIEKIRKINPYRDSWWKNDSWDE